MNSLYNGPITRAFNYKTNFVFILLMIGSTLVVSCSRPRVPGAPEQTPAVNPDTTNPDVSTQEPAAPAPATPIDPESQSGAQAANTSVDPSPETPVTSDAGDGAPHPLTTLWQKTQPELEARRQYENVLKSMYAEINIATAARSDSERRQKSIENVIALSSVSSVLAVVAYASQHDKVGLDARSLRQANKAFELLRADKSRLEALLAQDLKDPQSRPSLLLRDAETAALKKNRSRLIHQNLPDELFDKSEIERALRQIGSTGNEWWQSELTTRVNLEKSLLKVSGEALVEAQAKATAEAQERIAKAFIQNSRFNQANALAARRALLITHTDLIQTNYLRSARQQLVRARLDFFSSDKRRLWSRRSAVALAAGSVAVAGFYAIGWLDEQQDIDVMDATLTKLKKQLDEHFLTQSGRSQDYSHAVVTAFLRSTIKDQTIGKQEREKLLAEVLKTDPATFVRFFESEPNWVFYSVEGAPTVDSSGGDTDTLVLKNLMGPGTLEIRVGTPPDSDQYSTASSNDDIVASLVDLFSSAFN